MTAWDKLPCGREDGRPPRLTSTFDGRPTLMCGHQADRRREDVWVMGGRVYAAGLRSEGKADAARQGLTNAP